MLTGKLEGLEGALGNLQLLRKRSTRTKVARRALDIATRPMLAKAKQLCPVSEAPPLIPGLLKKSYGRKIKTYRNGTVVVLLGARTGFAQVVGQTADGKTIKQNPTSYDHFSELGTANEQAQPHLRPAFDTEKTAAEETARVELMKGIEAELAKGN